jgi:hypothetical protein
MLKLPVDASYFTSFDDPAERYVTKTRISRFLDNYGCAGRRIVLLLRVGKKCARGRIAGVSCQASAEVLAPELEFALALVPFGFWLLERLAKMLLPFSLCHPERSARYAFPAGVLAGRADAKSKDLRSFVADE